MAVSELTELRKGQYVTYPSDGADVSAYLSKPAAPGTYPGLVIIQGVYGLTPHCEIVCDRLADRGYVALAPALYSRTGTLTTDATGHPTPAARALKAQTPDPQVIGDLREAISYLKGMDEVGDHKIGGAGFCAGGRYGLFLLAADPRLDAFAAFYPTVTDEETSANTPVLVWDTIKDIHGSVCVLIGDQDTPTVEKYRERLRTLLAQHEKDYEYHLYAGAGHGFANEGSVSFQEEPWRAAWAVAYDYLERKLA
jgi:carboxymethylenebutenolidase